MRTESVTKNDLRFYALAPAVDGRARFQLPTALDLDDAQGYFQLGKVPRKQRKLTRTMWNMVHRQPRAPKAGEGEAEA